MLEQAALDDLRGHYAREELASVPALSSYEALLWEAWQTLSSDRQMSGMGGVGPIPWSSVVRYVEYYGMNRYEAHDLMRAVAALDPPYIRDAARRSSKAAKSAV